MLAILATSFHLSVVSLATGPLIWVPFGFPLSSFNNATALSSNETRSPVNLLYDFFWRMTIASKTWPFMSGLPARTETLTQSANFAYCCLPLEVFPCLTETILTILAPELSAARQYVPMLSARVALAVIGFIVFLPIVF